MSRAFTAPIHSNGRGAYVVVPVDVEATFGSKRSPVRATVGGAPYRGRLVRMGGPDHILLVTKAIREAIGKAPGNLVEVVVGHDDAPRTVDVPADLGAALAEAGARDAFDALSFTHRKEHVRAIEEAKQPETRARRIAKAVDAVR